MIPNSSPDDANEYFGMFSDLFLVDVMEWFGNLFHDKECGKNDECHGQKTYNEKNTQESRDASLFLRNKSDFKTVKRTNSTLELQTMVGTVQI